MLQCWPSSSIFGYTLILEGLAHVLGFFLEITTVVLNNLNFVHLIGDNILRSCGNFKRIAYMGNKICYLKVFSIPIHFYGNGQQLPGTDPEF